MADEEKKNDQSNEREAEQKTPDAEAKRRTIDKVHLVNFTAFRDFEMEFSPGINAIIGENATGKTHLMKLLYTISMCSNRDATKGDKSFIDELFKYFFTSHVNQWNVINRHAVPRTAEIAVEAGVDSIAILLDNYEDELIGSSDNVCSIAYDPILGIFIPAKDIISHKKHFLETYEKRQISFEKQYKDILVNAGLSPTRDISNQQHELLAMLEDVLGGKVSERQEVYHIVSGDFWLELPLVAEGLRKFALLWLLVRNGILAPSTVLFWDEPEANLNPKLIDKAVEFILQLQRDGVQVFLATHDYIVLKELDLLSKPEDKVLYHALYRDEEKQDIVCCSTKEYRELEPNPILDKYEQIYDRHVKRALKGDKNDS